MHIFKCTYYQLYSHVTQTIEDYRTQLKEMRFNSTVASYNMEALELAQRKQIPSINILALTTLCAWTNCTSDGSHRARFVNRMKGQLLLNALCISKQDQGNVQTFN